MANIAILGFGTVGSGVYEVAVNNKESIEKKSGVSVNVRAILDVRDFGDHPAKDLFVKDFGVIAGDSEIGVVVETIGGLDPAYQYSKAALESGKHVVTSNKELVSSKYGKELLEIAAANKVNYLFEASVGGGIPIIRPLQQCLVANQVTEICGILNGTTNYILTKMVTEGQSFEQALADASAKGYAESDPTADVEGHDACRKIAILASLAFGTDVSCDDIPTKGITDVTVEDIKKAEASGGVLKLIGQARQVDGKVQCKVEPTFIPKESPLANVNDVFNAILVRGDNVGEVMFYGPGAGKLPTASAVMADVVDLVKGCSGNCSCRT